LQDYRRVLFQELHNRGAVEMLPLLLMLMLVLVLVLVLAIRQGLSSSLRIFSDLASSNS